MTDTPPSAAEVLGHILREHLNCPVCEADFYEGRPRQHEPDCIVGRYEAAVEQAASRDRVSRPSMPPADGSPPR